MAEIGGDSVKFLAIFAALINIFLMNIFLFGQSIYFSPGLDLVLTVYDPFFEMKPTKPNEIGLFQVPNKTSILQIVSFSMPGFNDSASVGKLIGMQLVGAEELATASFWLGNQDLFYRRFSVSLSEKKSEGAQIVFLRGGKGYVLTYHSSSEEFWQHLIPAMLTMTSLKLGEKPDVYLNTDHNYTVKLMGPFVAVKPSQGEIGAFATVVDDKRGYVQIAKESLPRLMKVSEYSETVEKNTLTKLKNYRSISAGSNYVEGMDFAWRIFEFERQGIQYRCIQAYAVVEKNAHTMSYIAKYSDFEYFLPAAIYMMFSFKPIW